MRWPGDFQLPLDAGFPLVTQLGLFSISLVMGERERQRSSLWLLALPAAGGRSKGNWTDEKFPEVFLDIFTSSEVGGVGNTPGVRGTKPSLFTPSFFKSFSNPFSYTKEQTVIA